MEMSNDLPSAFVGSDPVHAPTIVATMISVTPVPK